MMFSALLLSLVLHVAGSHLPPKTPMAITILFEEPFASGASTFCSPRVGAGGTLDFYESGSNGTADAQDPVYPDMARAEAVNVTTGGGPTGQNYIDFAKTFGGGDDYSTAGVQFHVPVVVTPGSGVGAWTKRGAGVIATTGSFTTEVWIYSTAQSIADNIYAPIFELNRSISGPPSISLTASFYGAQQHLELDRSVAYGGSAGIYDDSYILTGYQDQWVRYQLVTGVSSAPGVADGYYKVYVQIGVGGTNTLIYNKTGVVVDLSADASVAVTAPATTAPNYRIATAQVGFFGLFGRAASFRIYEDTPAPPVPPVPTNTTPVVNNSNPPDCCTTTGGGGSVGATPPVDDTVIPDWVPSCVGGGYAPVASDIINSEAWDPQ